MSIFFITILHHIQEWKSRKSNYLNKLSPKISNDCKKIIDDDSLLRDEVESLMERLGLFCHPEGELLQEMMGFSDISNIFDKKEASLNEVKGAFDVFDENIDGYIDAKELQRVLCALGLKERSKMENCRWMIRLHDENGDGKIDFDEFAKFMDHHATSLCLCNGVSS